MQTKELWNVIVKDYKENYNQPEKVVQELWEKYFSEIFGYKKILKEIDAQRSIKIGSGVRTIPDIIIRKDNEDLFDVELKQYHLQFDNNMEQQLKSYMDLLHIAVGVLICNKIYVYAYDYSNKKFKRLTIDFIENNADGEYFIELFSSGNFQEKKVKEFIDSRNNEVQAIKEIQEIVTPDFLFDTLKNCLSDYYSNEVLDKALSDFEIVLQKKQVDPIQKVNAIDITKKPKENVIPKDIIDDFDCFIETHSMPDYIVIKTSEERVKACGGSLYEAVRKHWKAKLETASTFKYVLGVLRGQGIVLGVYEVDYWKQSDQVGRIEFFGHDAPNEIASQFIHKKIPYRFRKPGLASPFLYSTMQNK